MSDAVSAAVVKQVASTFGQTFDPPLKELGNYIADKVRYLRYKSLLRIMKKAEEKAVQQGMALKMPPIKFFVPFCEGASLETEFEEDDRIDVKSMWTNLLIKSCGNYDSRMNVFTRLLREITSSEIRFLRVLVEESRYRTYYNGSHFSYVDSSLISPEHYAHFAGKLSFLQDEEIAGLIIECFEGPGCRFYSVWTGEGLRYKSSHETSYLFDAQWYHSSERRAAHAVLLSLGVIKEFEQDHMYLDGERHVGVSGVHLTELGIDFVSVCSDFRGKTENDNSLIIDNEKRLIKRAKR